MSLVNKLLKDLESRETYLQDNQDLALEGLYSAYDVELNNHTTQKKQFLLFLISIVFVLLVIVSIWLNFSTSNSNIDNSVNEKTHKIVINNPVDDAQTTGNIQGNAPLSKTDLSLFSLKLDDLQNELHENQTAGQESAGGTILIKDLDIEESDNNIVLLFTLPAEPEYRVYTLESPYRTVLEINNVDYAGNLPAIESLPHITNIRKRIDKDGKFIFVLEASDSMSIVDAGYRQTKNVHALQITLETRKNQDVSNAQVTINSDPTPESTPVPESENPASLKDTVMKGELVKTLNTPPKVSSVDKKLVKSRELYKQGQVAESLDLLYSAVKEDEGHVQARATLALELIDQGQKELAISLLENGLKKYPDQAEWSKLLAHTYIDSGDYTMAKEILSRKMPPITADPEYYALYAAILDKMSLHEEAALTYQKLVNIQPENGLWWMGLAISLEKISRQKDAMFAYRNALNGKLLTPKTYNYIVDRIRYLESRLSSNESS